MRRRGIEFILMLPLLAFFTHCQNMGRTMSITSIDPSGGSTLGGHEVTISGRNFPEGSVPVVTFGAGSATVVSVTSTAIVVTTPASTGGVTEAVDVTVTDALGKSAESKGGFTYRTMLFATNKGASDASQFDFNRETPLLEEFTTSPTPTGGATPTDIRVDEVSQLAFMTNFIQAISVMSYSFADGSLTPVAGSPFQVTGAAGLNAVAVDPVHHLIFTANGTTNDVSSYTYDPDTGELSLFEHEEVTGGTFPQDIAVDPARMLIFVVNSGSNNMAAFRYDASGDMEMDKSSPFDVGGKKPVAIDIDATRSHLFVALETSAVIESISYDTTGKLTSLDTISSAGTLPSDVAVDPSSGLVFVVNRNQVNNGTLKGFEVDADGTMTPAAGQPIGTGGDSPSAVVLDKAGLFAFVSNSGANTGIATIAPFSYLSDGTLTEAQNPVDAGGTLTSMMAFVP